MELTISFGTNSSSQIVDFWFVVSHMVKKLTLEQFKKEKCA